MDDDEEEDHTILKKKLELINKGRSYYHAGDTWESIRYYFDEKQEDYSYGNIERRDLEFTYDAYRDFKEAYSIMDFTDMLTLSLKPEVTFKKYKIVFVDECQDLNPLMWKVINKIIDKQGDVYLAGDDDQSIFGFNCGTPELFLNYASHKEKILWYYRGIDNFFMHKGVARIKYFPIGWFYSYNQGYIYPHDTEKHVFRKIPYVCLFDSMGRKEDVKF